MTKRVINLMEEYKRVFGEYPPSFGYSEEALEEAIKESLATNEEMVGIESTPEYEDLPKGVLI